METAVTVRGAYKSYGIGPKRRPVLKNLNMTVPRGSIYGLLGASGCGKTTLLNCVVGIRDMDQGEVWVLGGHPGSVKSGVPGPRTGYMPQEIALIEEFSIKEALYYFGRLEGMDHPRIKERYEFLSKLLELPQGSHVIKNCSGGQARRVSFAVTLIHEPELLILDEPTVGLDPILRETMWNHLMFLARQKNTAIIITTHYIEETKQADIIGLLRGGELLAEDAPLALLRLFNKERLEDIFLYLSEKQSRNEPVLEFQREDYIADKRRRQQLCLENGVATIENGTEKPTSGASMESVVVNHVDQQTVDIIKSDCEKPVKFSRFSGRRIQALLSRDWAMFRRNPSEVFLMLFIPILQVVIFFLAIGKHPKHLGLGIVNDEINSTLCATTEISSVFTRYVPSNGSCSMNWLSCAFINEFDDDYVTKRLYDDFDVANEDLRRNKITAILYFTKNFTDATVSRQINGIQTNSYDAIASEMPVYIDNSDLVIGIYLQKVIFEKYIKYITKTLDSCGLNAKYGDVPIQFLGPVYGTYDDTYEQFMVPGILVTVLFFLSTVVTSMVVVKDRLSGVWDRNIVAGVTVLELMLDYIVVQCLIMLMMAFALLFFTIVIFDTHIEGPFFDFALLVVLQGVVGICNGLLVSVISTNHSVAHILSSGTFLPMIFLCGIIWPIEGMPSYFQFWAIYLPFTKPILSLRHIAIRGWGIFHAQVFDGYVISLVWIVIYGLLFFLILRKKF